VRVLDCSTYLPTENIDARLEYEKAHIPGAMFFDIDATSDQHSNLPHTLPSAQSFAESVGKLGIGNSHQVIVYDGAGLFSAARVWWMFRVFGHDRVRVLNGGLPAWRAAGGALTQDSVEPSFERFDAALKPDFVVDKERMLNNVSDPKYTVLDARSAGRFAGTEPEPRPGLPSGHIPGSQSLPFSQLLENGCLKPASELVAIFRDNQIDSETPIITSCGSGVTAAIITLALAECGFGLQKLYDGSWTEWASAEDTEIMTS
jgi:thiosulfate/3-mercaptopyruvate sulfurtransferase